MKKATRNKKRTTVTKTLSLPKQIAEAGEQMADKEIRTFSNYVASLIERDAKQSEAVAA